MDLLQLGWDTFFAGPFRRFAEAGFDAARVVSQGRGGYALVSAQGELTAEVSGRFRFDAASAADFPVTGDWAAVEVLPGEARAVIHALLPRRTKFSRLAPGRTGDEQVLAANVDDAFIVAALSDRVNLRRLERSLALAWESGANPGLILTKVDLCTDSEAAVARVESIAPGVPVLALSSVTGSGIAGLTTFLRPGRTAVLLGPSGVGKSTLINYLCGEALLDTQPIRESDQKGRHTTTRREMIRLPSGALIIDTPGLRELQLWEGDSGIEEAFSDIEALAARCRFTDCQHETEPGCAVRAAITGGELDQARVESHRKLRREREHFERKHDKRAQADERLRDKRFARKLRTTLQAKGRR